MLKGSTEGGQGHAHQDEVVDVWQKWKEGHDEGTGVNAPLPSHYSQTTIFLPSTLLPRSFTKKSNICNFKQIYRRKILIFIVLPLF